MKLLKYSFPVFIFVLCLCSIIVVAQDDDFESRKLTGSLTQSELESLTDEELAERIRALEAPEIKAEQERKQKIEIQNTVIQFMDSSFPDDWRKLDDEALKVRLRVVSEATEIPLNKISFDYLRDDRNGFLKEYFQSIAYAILRVWGSKELLREKKDWKPYPTYEVVSLDPIDIARTIGSLLGFILAIGIPISFLVLLFLWLKELMKKKKTDKINSIQNQKQAEKEAQQAADQAILAAMEELETGNMDKLTWAKAMIAADGDEKRAKIEYLKLRGQ